MGVLDGKAAIVTGSARGIGRATAELLAEQGARVLINDLDEDVAEQAASEISGETTVFGGDLTKEGVPDQLVQKAVDEFGQIDIIVNNAGYTRDGVTHKMTDDQFQAMLDIHTVVPFRVIRAAAGESDGATSTTEPLVSRFFSLPSPRMTQTWEDEAPRLV